MSKNEWEKVDEKINRKLREFEVDVPDFPMKKSSLDRLANWMFQPVSMPFSSLNLVGKRSMPALQMLPFIIIIIASAIPLFF